MGLDYQLEGDDWGGDLPQKAIEGIRAGLEDVKAGRVHTHEEVVAFMTEKLDRLRAKNG
jgi:predicted transcriptional regulator